MRSSHFRMTWVLGENILPRLLKSRPDAFQILCCNATIFLLDTVQELQGEIPWFLLCKKSDYMVVWFLMSLKSPDNWRCHPILFAQISLPWLLWCHNPAHSPAAEVGSRESFVGKVSIFNVINRKAPKTLQKCSCGFSTMLCTLISLQEQTEKNAYLCICIHFNAVTISQQIKEFMLAAYLLSPYQQNWNTNKNK